MKILFTGAESPAGEPFLQHLCSQGHSIWTVAQREIPNVQETIIGDLEADDISGILPKMTFDALIHFASFIPLTEETSSWDECYKKNVLSSVRLMQWAKDRIGKVIISSSLSVYGDPLYAPADESHQLYPVTNYALSKYAEECLFQAFCRSNSIPLVVMRLGDVYGPRMSRHEAVVKFILAVQTRQQIRLHDPESSGLPLIHNSDIAIIGNLLLAEGDGVYNIVMPGYVSLIELVRHVEEVVGAHANVITSRSNRQSLTNYYVSRRLIDKHRAAPSVELHEGIKTVVDWLGGIDPCHAGAFIPRETEGRV